MNQYIQPGSSTHFVYEKLSISGRSSFIYWISFFKLEYSLDGSNWLFIKILKLLLVVQVQMIHSNLYLNLL